MAAASSRPTASAHRDKAGRPLIAVTGMGVVTSLAVGKADNWAKLTAGKSGIRRISRFPLELAAYHHRRHRRRRLQGLYAAGGIVGAHRAPRRRGGSRAVRHWRQGPLSRSAVPRFAAARNRVALPHPDGRRGRARQRCRLSRSHAGGARAAIQADLRDAKIRHHRRAPRRSFRHRGIADLADHRLRLRRDRDPARRRGDPARRVQGRARARRRRVADAGIAGSLFAAFGAVDAERSARAGVEAVLQEPRRFCAGRRRRRAGTRRLRSCDRARRKSPRHSRRLR